MPPKKAPARMDVYVVLDAKRVMPPALELPSGYPELHPVGEYRQYPAGGPKGAKIVSEVDGPIEDIYTTHYVATADVLNADGDLLFQPEAERLFQIIALGTTGELYGLKLADDILEKVQELVGAGLSQSELAGEIASMRRQVQRR
jgi:hypothetical protein